MKVSNNEHSLICESTRKQGNTAQILRQLSIALEVETITTVFLADLHLNGCLGCSVCQKDLEKPRCVQQDDVTALLQQVMEADVALYGTPLYGHSYSGQLKDRHVALFKFVDGGDTAVEEMEILSFIRNKPVALVVSCQGPEKHNTELVAMQFEKFYESSLACNLGIYVFPWCHPNVKESNYSQDTL